jgi:hypothetical protein
MPFTMAATLHMMTSHHSDQGCEEKPEDMYQHAGGMMARRAETHDE